ncbi:nucleosome assembly protein 1-like 4 isoform X3 [Hyperolius riggenbachi]|uniref:nucleosome assembly protein 1-like 4 isoform X3 n=1 Tax=Hyperolius riggenbachi TaxID=752182 RepID=UPI0035A32997
MEGNKNAPDKKEKLADQMMQNPQVLAALQERFDSNPHTPSSYVETLPKAVKRRINALKQLQEKCAHIEAKFYEEVHELERKYAALYEPLFEQRRVIVTGQVEPTDAECEWQSGGEEEDKEKLAEDVKKKMTLSDTPSTEDLKGIPDFWLTIFKNVDMINISLQEHDEPILKHLQDVKVKFSGTAQPMSFSLEFHFGANEFFNNQVLTKTYKMKSEPDSTDPFSFEGPEIIDCEGCTIDWKKGKNVTVKTIKKKQKHKGRGTVRTITKQVPNESFFNFFSPVKASGEGEEMDEETENSLAADFELGHFFRERIVPRAVLYFTGEAIEDEESFEEDEEGEEEEMEGDDDGECEDDDDEPVKKEAGQPAECKQQ